MLRSESQDPTQQLTDDDHVTDFASQLVFLFYLATPFRSNVLACFLLNPPPLYLQQLMLFVLEGARKRDDRGDQMTEAGGRCDRQRPLGTLEDCKTELGERHFLFMFLSLFRTATKHTVEVAVQHKQEVVLTQCSFSVCRRISQLLPALQSDRIIKTVSSC